MSDRSPLEKLRLKPGMTATVRHVPASLESIMGLPSGVSAVDDPSEADFILDFATTQAEAEERMRSLAPLLRQKAVLWIGYPKGSKAAGHDLSRDTIWRFGSTVGLVINANFAIDETWSAVRMRAARPGE